MRRYGTWSGNSAGKAEIATRCIAEVYPLWNCRGMISFQCSRKRGHGPHGLYCKQHARMIAGGRHVSVPEDEQ